ncbi:MAG: metallopeptidase TldD-related protein [candidate division WOR-3 bacterium]
MEKILDFIKKKMNKFELFYLKENFTTVIFENSKLKDIKESIQSGVSLRILKDGKMGFAYTKNLKNIEEFFQNAVYSLSYGVEAPFDFPINKRSFPLNSYDSSIEEVSTSKVIDECRRVIGELSMRVSGQINIYAGFGVESIEIENNYGTSLTSNFSEYYLTAEILYPASHSAIMRSIIGKSFKEIDKEFINFVSDIYERSKREVKIKRGKMKVLFLPETMYVLIWRLLSATSGKSVYKKESPVYNKLGEKLFSSKLTIYDDPLNDEMPFARSFDDEGVQTKYLPIIEEGVLENFYYDLYYGGKMGVNSTGHGYKVGFWGEDKISLKPSPLLRHLYIKCGENNFKELLSMIDKGLIIGGALGAHSGNIPNGDFSIGGSPGIYVEKGEIVGYVKDVMIAGNIYDVMKNIEAIENKQHSAYMGNFPAILFSDVSITV